MEAIIISLVNFISRNIYEIFTFWFICSTVLLLCKIFIKKAWGHDYIYDVIPSVFITLGVLGTFAGIAGGLDGFDVNNIEGSIPTLLEGLKSAFYTSIIGIFLSILFGRIADLVANYVDKNTEEKQTADTKPEFDFNKLYELLSNLDSTTQDTVLQSVASAVSSLEGTLKKERVEQTAALEKVEQAISAINEALGVEKTKTAEIKAAIEENTKALGALSKLDALSSLEDIKQSNEALKESAETISLQLESAQENLNKQFEGLSETLAENNTKALVEVMENATKSFNQQMKTIVERLVKENFQELNNSVQQLNQWQQEHKQQVATLTKKFEEASAGFSETVEASQQIVDNAERLVAEDSKLSKLVKELGRLLVDSEGFSKVIKDMENLSLSFNSSVESWNGQKRELLDAVNKLTVRLLELEKVDIHNQFWGRIESNLNQGTNIINNHTKLLKKQLEDNNDIFNEQLNKVLKGLDAVIRRFLENDNS